MMPPKHRYNGGTQRARGFLEIASALYDSILSRQSVDELTGRVQTNPRVGHKLDLSLANERKEKRSDGVDLRFVAGGFYSELKAVADGKISVLWISSCAALSMAHRGVGPFRKPLPLRALAVFPSWDAIGFAVRGDIGIGSFADIKRSRYPLRISTRELGKPPYLHQKTIFAIDHILRDSGLSLQSIRRWGGRFQAVPRPSDPRRLEAIANGTVEAVFDEGVKMWGPTAIKHGFRFLSIADSTAGLMEKLGFQRIMLTQEHLSGLPEPVQSLNIGGWPLIARKEMPDDVAYAICQAIELRKDLLPTDNGKPLDMRQICAYSEETPRDVPLHPGAERFYRDQAYLA